MYLATWFNQNSDVNQITPDSSMEFFTSTDMQIFAQTPLSPQKLHICTFPLTTDEIHINLSDGPWSKSHLAMSFFLLHLIFKYEYDANTYTQSNWDLYVLDGNRHIQASTRQQKALPADSSSVWMNLMSIS